MSELLDFTGKKDFEDLKFGKGYHLTQDDISVFKEDCRRINTIHNQMALEQCKIGLLLSELKAGKTWQSVINTKTGFAYLVHSFEDFCKDAFGFSGTKTYALMQIAKFVTSNSENEVHFIDEKYSEFSSSQLTELASVPTYKRHFFTADMTIEQMRFVKKYIETDEFLEDRQKENFDLLTYANNYAESKKKPKALPASNPDVMDGQMSLFPEDNEDVEENGAEEIFPTSGKIENGEEQEVSEEDEDNSPEHQEYLKESEPWIEGTDEKKEQAIKIALIDRTGTIRRQRIYEKYQQRPLQSEFVKFLKEEYGNSGWCVCGLNGSTDFKGYRITPSRGAWGIFMSWHTVASHIVSFINTGEYFPERNEETDDGAGVSNPTSDLAELGEEIIEEEIERGYTNDVDEYNELDEAQEDMRADMETIEQEAEESVSGKYCFGARAHVRNFISDYQAWPGRCGHFFLSPCWCYSLKNGAVIYAMTYDSFVDFSENITTKRVLYFLQEKGSKTIEISKEQFERWCSEHKQEL